MFIFETLVRHVIPLQLHSRTLGGESGYFATEEELKKEELAKVSMLLFEDGVYGLSR